MIYAIPVRVVWLCACVRDGHTPGLVLCVRPCFKPILFVKSHFQGYSVEQKRAVFFKFVELFHDQNFPQELKAKVCTTARRSVDLSRFLRQLPALLLGL